MFSPKVAPVRAWQPVMKKRSANVTANILNARIINTSFFYRYLFLGCSLNSIKRIERIYEKTIPRLLVNEGSCLYLFLTGFVFCTGYLFGFIILLQLLHLAIGLNFVACSCRASSYRRSSNELAPALTETG